MTEKEFWEYLEKAPKQGIVQQISSTSLEKAGPEMQGVGSYIGGHALLPEDYDKLPVDTIVRMGELLLANGIKPSTKEAIMVILAHHGCDEALLALRKFIRRAHGELRIFGEIALQECEMWNEDWH